MSEAIAKIEIIELLSKYLLCLDERRFDYDSFSKVFTDNAEVNIPSKVMPVKECRGLKEIRDLHVSLFRLIKSSHHQSGDFVFISLSDSNAEIRCNITGYFDSFSDECSISTGFIKFFAVKTENGWRIQTMNRRTRNFYNLSNYSKSQEMFL